MSDKENNQNIPENEDIIEDNKAVSDENTAENVNDTADNTEKNGNEDNTDNDINTENTDSTDNAYESEAKPKKKLGAGKIVLIVIASLLAVILIPSAIIFGSLIAQYNKLAYEKHHPVEREDEYVMPDYPEVTIDTSGEWQEGVDLYETETEAVETEIETETETEAETETETDSDQAIYSKADKASETQKSVETEAPETLANIVNTPSETKTYTEIPYNPDASFATSENTVSVYGNTPIYKVTQKDSSVRNILIMGTDSRDVTLDRGRSDVMMIASYNSKSGTLKLISLLRDSLVPIEGVGWNRLNTAYFYGGVGLTINTVNQLYGLDIQEFVVIDFSGVKNFIEYIGGVDIELTAEEAALYSTYTGRTISAGINHLDPELTLTHMRNRTIGNDFGRTKRQRDTIKAIANQLISTKSVTDLYDITTYAFSLIKTNISATDLIALATSVLTSGSLSIETENVPFSDAYQFAWYNGMSIISYDISAAGTRLNKFIYN